MRTPQNVYYYHKGKVTARAVAHTVLSVLLIAFGVFCFVHWELDFMFYDWKGWMMLSLYGLITLGCVLSAVNDFGKVAKASRGIPALGVGADFFVVYDSHGLAIEIPFEQCERVRFNLEYWLHGSIHMITLIIKCCEGAVPSGDGRFEIPLYELDVPQSVVDRRLKKIYHNYKREHQQPASE